MNILEKKCRVCEIIKDIKEFYIRKSSKDGYRGECKGCNKIYKKKYYQENIDIINEKNKEWKENNKDKIKEYSKKWNKENSDKIKEYSKKWREENKDHYNEYHRNRISNNPLIRLKSNMRNLIYHSLKNSGYTKGSKSNDILGCSYEELLDHLNDNEFGFIYGDDNLDIDHIIPLNKATTKNEMMELNHYSNLQLLPADYNRHIKRDNDFDKEDFERWLEKNK